LRRCEGGHIVVGETREEQVFVVEFVVNAGVVGVVVLRLVRADSEVVGERGVCRRREELQVGQRDRIDGKTRCSVGGREQRLWAVAGAYAVDVIELGLGGDGAGVGDAGDRPESLIVKEEEGPISKDGSADAAAVLVLAKFWLGAGVLEEGASVEDVVAEVLVDRAVELVRSRAGDDVEYTAGRASSFCGVAVGLDRDLLNAFDVRLDADGADNTFVVVDTVDDPVVETFVLSVDREARGIGAAIVRTATTAE